ncbi:MAG: nitroreductase family protein [Chloroflexi bacterium]|nr:nitroreductase family protein [Chloroflexota bacterium]
MDTFKTIATRKSTRGFRDTQIDENDLIKILAAGGSAPIAMGAYETMHITVVQNKERLEKISALVAASFNRPNMQPFYDAPTLIIIAGKKGAHGMAVEELNAGCIAENMLLAATELGLGSVFVLGTIAAFKTDPLLIRSLNIPEGYTPICSIIVGYAKEGIKKQNDMFNKINYSVIK